MSDHGPANPPLQVPKPPTRKETKANPAQTLTWITDRINDLYFLDDGKQARAEPLVLNLLTYVSIYSTVADYNESTIRGRRARVGLTVDGLDLYRSLEKVIRRYCQESLVRVREPLEQPPDSTDDGAASELVTAYIKQWAVFLKISRVVANLLRSFERHFIARELDEKRLSVYTIHNLHMALWREEVLGLNEAFVQSSTGLEKFGAIRNALVDLQHVHHGSEAQGEANVDTVAREISDSLSKLSLTVSDGSLAEHAESN